MPLDYDRARRTVRPADKDVATGTRPPTDKQVALLAALARRSGRPASTPATSYLASLEIDRLRDKLARRP